MLSTQPTINSAISFEFFPPKSNTGLENLVETAKSFLPNQPKYFSMTFGAGGSAQDSTQTAVLKLQKHFNVPIAPHISCISSSQQEIINMLSFYKKNHINRLVALRGDLPPGVTRQGELKHATELVDLIRKKHGEDFFIYVGAYPEFHPEAINAQKDLMFFKDKVNAGANAAITQYFYNIDAYLRFINACQQTNINIPIIPGIMPIYNCQQLERFSDICGAELPRWIRKQLESIQDDEQAVRQFGIDVVTELCSNLLAHGVPELHFYTLNKCDIVNAILTNLKIK